MPWVEDLGLFVWGVCDHRIASADGRTQRRGSGGRWCVEAGRGESGELIQPGSSEQESCRTLLLGKPIPVIYITGQEN